MRRVRHLKRLFEELAGYSVVNRVWWPVPMMAMFLTIGGISTVGQSLAPLLYVLW